MEIQWKKYRAVSWALIGVPTLALILWIIGFLRVRSDDWLEALTLLFLWTGVLAFVFYKADNTQRGWWRLLRVAAMIFTFFMILILDEVMKTPSNPLTVILIIAYAVGVLYMIIPSFIKKYYWILLIILVPVCLYYAYTRYMYPNDAEEPNEILAVGIVLSIPLMILLWLYEQWKWFKQLKADKAQAELALLKSQINPHFFFNTLNNLYSLSVNASEKAPEVILQLSNMMRYTIYEGKKDRVPLEDELDYLENYVALHKIRHQGELEVTLSQDIEPGIEISPLLFINLVENAFKHGVEKLTEGAWVTIEVYARSTELRFNVRNNFDPGEIIPEVGIGLSNLRQRLALIYPRQYTLTTGPVNQIYTASLIIKNP